MNLSRGDEIREKRIGGEKKPSGTVKAVAVSERINFVSEPQTKNIEGVDLAWLLLRKVTNAALVILKVATKPRPRLMNPQMFIERVRSSLFAFSFVFFFCLREMIFTLFFLCS